MPNITDFLFKGGGILIFKIPLLAMILVYVLFLFIVINRIKALNRTMTIQANGASNLLQTIAAAQCILAFLLFLLTIFSI